MAWQSEAKTTDLLSELSYSEDRVRDAARSVRHCAFCREGWQLFESDGYNYAQRCPCFLEWEREMNGYRKAKMDYEKATKSEVELNHNLFDFHHIADEASTYSPERRATVLEIAASLGNVFANRVLDDERGKVK